jgi:hypothetical protein
MKLKINRKTEHQQGIVTSWANVPVGTDVVVTKDDGKEIRTRTRSEAFLLGGHTACIQLEGISGCYALERVRKA